MKLKTLKIFSLVFLFLIINHYWCKGWTTVEIVASDSAEKTANAVMIDVSDKLGLEPKKIIVPEPELGLVEFASLTAADEDVSPILVRAVLKVENHNRPYGVSVKGAIGPMQVMPEHVKFCKLAHVGKLYDEKTNIRCGIKVLKEALRVRKNNVILALRDYNGGPKCVSGGCAESEKYWVDVLQVVAVDGMVV